MATTDVDEWAGEGVTPIRPSDTFPLKGEGYAVSFSCFKERPQTLTELRDWLLPMLMNGQVTIKT